jgi:hypothetical protein
MKKSVIVGLSLGVLLAPALSAEDLYLLKLNNQEELKIANSVIDYARGMIDGGFLVELDSIQQIKLKNYGLNLEFLKADYNPQKSYLVSRMSHEQIAKGEAFRAFYSSENTFIAELSEEEIIQANKEGYFITSLRDKKTPLFYAPTAVGAFLPDNFPYDSLADRISQDSIYANNRRLEQYYTRYIYSDSIYAARDWLVSKFLSYGYTDVYYDYFDYYGRMCHNVICMKEGVESPDNLIVVGAHYDSYNTETNPWYYAPGADDNGSGVATVLELARVLADVPLKKSVMFVAFSAEEVGLVGSYVVANNLYYQGANVEFMLNFDMVGYTNDGVNDVAYYYGPLSAYAAILRDAALRVTNINVFTFGGVSGNSDHASFMEFGYNVAYVQEGDFNYPGWHTNADLTANMNFPYLAEISRMSVAALGQVDLAARVTFVDAVYDVGDGSSLRLAWENSCQAGYTYRALIGTQSGVYTDTFAVGGASCYYDFEGLTTGQKYYVTVLGINEEGHGPVYTIEASGTPYEIPRPPRGLRAEPDTGRILLSWDANMELDLDHYVVLRRPEGGSWQTIKSNATGTSYWDESAVPHVYYEYGLLAADSVGNISEMSGTAAAAVASFDGGLLFVEETSSGGMDPSEEAQEAYYDSIFGGGTYSKYYLDSPSQALSRSRAGQYSSIIWVDDDVSTHLLNSSDDSLRWYLGYDSADILIAGMETVFWLTSSGPLSPGHFIYDNFGINRVTENQNLDFTGATGLNGWPDLEVNPNCIFMGKLPTISVFEVLPGAEVIYTYDSYSGNPAFAGKPAGVIYESGGGKRIALSFPLYYMSESGVEAMIAKVLEEFGEEINERPFGDANGDGRLNALDVTFILNYLYKGGEAPSDLDYADPNGSCVINALDITYLINYLYKGGPGPKAGCVP